MEKQHIYTKVGQNTGRDRLYTDFMCTTRTVNQHPISDMTQIISTV